MTSPEKPNRKRRTEKHNKRKHKFKKAIEKIEKTFFKQKKSRGDKKKLFFFSENQFSKEIFAKINCK